MRMSKWAFTLAGAAATLTGLTATAQGQEAHAPPYYPAIREDGTSEIKTFDLPYSSFASKEARDLYVERSKKPLLYFRFKPDTPIAEVRKVMDEEWFAPQIEAARKLYPADVEVTQIGGVRVQIFTPAAGIAPENAHRVLINLHGGGFNVGSMTASQVESLPLATVGRIKVISIDYRMFPEHRFPAASEDVAAVYRELLKTYRADQMAMFGCSAGGMLTGQAVAWFDKLGLPQPSSVGVFCAALRPFAGDSSIVTPRLGGVIPPPDARALGYFSMEDLGNPLAFPSNSPAVLAKFPPTLFITGSRAGEMSAAAQSAIDLNLAGVEAKLMIWDGLDHAFFMDAQIPESRQAIQFMADFFKEHFGRPMP